MKIKKVFGNLLLIGIPFVLFELLFRALPVSYPPYSLPVSSATPVARLQPNSHYVFSKGWDFSIKTNKYSNNYGYINENNYEADASSPLMMVIGDSFVEAHHVDAGKSAAEILHSKTIPDGRVYSIGLSGAALSQYLIFAEFSKSTFDPGSMAFVIIGNDFDESLAKYMTMPRLHRFQEDDGDLTLERVDYALSSTKALLRKSALVRYVMLNLEASATIARFLDRTPAQESEFVANVPVQAPAEKISDSKMAMDKFFDELPTRSGLDATKILFLIDGIRPALYSQDGIDKAKDSYVAQMNRYFEKLALARGYEVTNMQPVFIKRNRLDNSRFEFESDGHWNELGNRLVAEEIEKSAVFRSTFSR